MISSATNLRSPYPWFGGKRAVAPLVWSRYFACNGHWQFAGCLPVFFVLLFVLQRFVRRASTHDATACDWNSSRCSAKCDALDVSSRFPGSSFSLSRSLWWIPMPRGIGPCSRSQTYRARSTHLFGSATLINARRSPPRLCRVRILTVPTGNLFSPPDICPSSFLMQAL